jgi:hypothetical protein
MINGVFFYIEGRDVTNDIENLEEFTLEVGYNSNKAIVNKLSETITFKSDTDTYTYLKSVFYTGCNGLEKELRGTFVSGNINIPLIVTVEDGDYSGESISVIMKSDDVDEEAYLYFDQTYWFNNDFPQAYEIPIMYFAVQPNQNNYIILLFTASIRGFLTAIDTAVRLICKRLPVIQESDCDIGLTRAVFGKLDTWLTGLGRWACAPLIREIITHHCDQVGIRFQSSLINDPSSDYYDMAMFDISRGGKGDFNDTSRGKRMGIMLENSYLMTVMDLIRRMSDLFEAEYRLIDGVLYIETPDFFDRLRTIKVHDTDHCTKYSYDSREMYAYGEFSFAEDGVDREGTKTSYLYAQKLEWNNPPSKAQKGKLTRTHLFGVSRYMFDQFSYHKDGFFDWERLVDEFRDGPDSLISGFFANQGVIRERDMCISVDQLTYPKLVVFEKNFDRNDAFVIRQELGRIKGKPFYMYNYPLYYKENGDSIVNEQLVSGEEGPLTAFAKTADPRLKRDLLRIDSEDISCSQDIIDKLVRNFHTVYVNTEFGKGYPENAVIRFSKTGIDVTLQDIRVVCR